MISGPKSGNWVYELNQDFFLQENNQIMCFIMVRAMLDPEFIKGILGLR